MGGFITARKRSLRRLCFYTCLSVILFTGGSTWAGTSPGQVHPKAGTPPGRYPLGTTPPGHYTPQASTPPWAGTSPMGRYTPLGRYTPRQVHPTGRACWDMVNKRAVRIPLEYILVQGAVRESYTCSW